MGQETTKRGRPKKTPIEQKEDVLNEKKAPLVMGDKGKLTTQDVMRSLTGLFQTALGTEYSNTRGYSPLLDLNAYNPFLQNNRLKQINALPTPYSPEEILKALKQPQNNEEMLQQSSAALSASQYLYYLILREAADIPLFKYFVIPPLLKEEEYNKPDFQNEEEFVNEWLETFDIPNTLKRVALNVKREGKPSYVIRQSLYEDEKKKKRVNYVTWQKLPPRYVKLTAIGEHGYITSFNLMLFMNPGFSPKQYPEFIQDIWEDMHKNVFIKDSKGKEIPDLNKLRKYSYSYNGNTIKGICELTDSTYMYWVQLPQDLCFSFASDSSNAWSVPDTMGLFSALQELTDYSTLAGLVTSTPLTSVLTGQAEFVENSQPGQDQTKMAPSTMSAFQNAFNAMVSGNVQAFLAPFKDLKLQSLPNVPNSSDIKTKAVQNFISTAGEGGLITATDKPSVAMIKGAQYQAAARYDFVTKQFQSVLNNNLKKWAGLKYKWRVVLWGDIFTFADTVKTMKEMVTAGTSFLLPKLASAFDLNMIEVRSISTYLDAFKIYDKFKPLNYFNQKQQKIGKSVGRPAMDEDDVTNDNTAASKDAGNNVSEVKEFAAQHMCILCGASTEEGHILCEECEAELETEEVNNG